ncbi:MAG TPA: carbamoyl phosphate synthase small subunit, partial [Thermoleophilia bacterium]|nr:carbamoyl phosphate synthase small subunit [Thermoleophilia bacterium]
EVTCREVREIAPADSSGERWHVVVVDLGVKRSILDLLIAEGCRLTVVPASTSARAILKLAPHGVLLSNGPGDPAAVTYAVKTARRLLGSVPLFGICLGHQLLALALGLDTFKLPFGHHGINHPVKDLRTGRVEITTQNHGFAVAQPERLPPGVELTHVNLNDGTVEGLADASRYAFSVQYHPEASPGPYDARYLFARFTATMEAFRAAGASEDAESAGARGRGGGAGTGMASKTTASTAGRRTGERRGHAEGEDEERPAEADKSGHDGEGTPKGERPSLKDALRGHLGSLGDLGRKER